MAETINFDSASPGALPPEWVCGVTGSGGSRWLVEADASAPSKPNVVKQSGVGDFPWCALKSAAVTDGFVEAEREVFTQIRENLNGANVFCFGIGSSVNRHLVEGIARAGLGEPFVVLDASDSRKVADRFREYVRAPVLTDVAVEFEGLDVHDVEPKSFPDVLADRPLLIYGKWKGEPLGRIVVHGLAGAAANCFACTFAVAAETTFLVSMHSAVPLTSTLSAWPMSATTVW